MHYLNVYALPKRLKNHKLDNQSSTLSWSIGKNWRLMWISRHYWVSKWILVGLYVKKLKIKPAKNWIGAGSLTLHRVFIWYYCQCAMLVAIRSGVLWHERKKTKSNIPPSSQIWEQICLMSSPVFVDVAAIRVPPSLFGGVWWQVSLTLSILQSECLDYSWG